MQKLAALVLLAASLKDFSAEYKDSVYKDAGWVFLEEWQKTGRRSCKMINLAYNDLYQMGSWFCIFATFKREVQMYTGLMQLIAGVEKIRR